MIFFMMIRKGFFLFILPNECVEKTAEDFPIELYCQPLSANQAWLIKKTNKNKSSLSQETDCNVLSLFLYWQVTKLLEHGYLCS